jgi:CBS domain-containing protein
MTLVKDIMQSDVVTVPRDASIQELSRILADNAISGAPVTDSYGQVVGVVSATDLLELAADQDAFAPNQREGRGTLDIGDFEMVGPDEGLPGTMVAALRESWGDLDDRVVGEIMNPVRFAVAPETTVVELARFMTAKRIHRALVVSEGELAGIVSTFDVLKAVAEGLLVEA